MRVSLFALAIGAFGIGSTEWVMMGLLPQIGDTLQATVPAMGLLITAYAVGVVVGAPLLTALSAWLSTRTTLIVLAGLFVVGNIGAALAPTYPVMMISRVVTALAHGAFFGVGAIAARRAVPAEKATQAISIMFTGLTVANVVGVPIGTLVGQHLSWRWVFAGIAVIGVATMVALRRWLPAESDRIDLRTELAGFRRGPVWLALGVTAVGFGALFAVYSYVTPILTGLAGLSGGAVTVVLALFGVGATAGTLLGGRYGDRFGYRAVAVGFVLQIGVLALFTATTSSAAGAVLTLMVFAVLTFALGPILQNKVIEAARAETGVPGRPASTGSLVSATSQGAFNLANALGAALGAFVLSAGAGYRATMWVGAGLAAAGLLLLVGGVALLRRARPAAAGDPVARADRPAADPDGGTAVTADRGAESDLPALV